MPPAPVNRPSLLAHPPRHHIGPAGCLRDTGMARDSWVRVWAAFPKGLLRLTQPRGVSGHVPWLVWFEGYPISLGTGAVSEGLSRFVGRFPTSSGLGACPRKPYKETFFARLHLNPDLDKLAWACLLQAA